MRQILLLFTALFISCSTIQQATIISKTAIADGVDVIEASYTVTRDGETLPTKIFVMDVALSNKITILATAAADNNSSIKATNELQTAISPISKQLEAMQSKRRNVNVLGGVNSDFYAIHRSNMVQGVMYRGGECLKGGFADDSNVFLMLKDGTARCLTAEEYLLFDKSHKLDTSNFELPTTEDLFYSGKNNSSSYNITKTDLERIGNSTIYKVGLIYDVIVNNEDTFDDKTEREYQLYLEMLKLNDKYNKKQQKQES